MPSGRRIDKCSADTALRDINDLLGRGVLAGWRVGGAVRGIYWLNISQLG